MKRYLLTIATLGASLLSGALPPTLNAGERPSDPTAYFQVRAKLMQAKLMEEEKLAAYYGQDLRYYQTTKIPNPYHSAKNLADYYRMKWQSALDKSARASAAASGATVSSQGQD